MAQITINGKSIVVNGNNVNITNGRVIVDGNDVTPCDDVPGVQRQITVEIHGDVNDLSTGSADVKVTGNVGRIQTGAGDIEVSGDVKGPIQTGSGDVNCNTAHGTITTMSGSVKTK